MKCQQTSFDESEVANMKGAKFIKLACSLIGVDIPTSFCEFIELAGGHSI